MMNKLLAVFMMCLIGAVVQATPIDVENYSFELPGTDKISTDWTQVPGWSSDSAPSDSGVASDWTGSTDGSWSGFLMTSDSSVYNLTEYVIAAGDVFQLQVDVQDNWSPDGTTSIFQLSLYCDDGGTRVTVASVEVNPVWPWATYTLTFSADDYASCIGHQIGIELDNVSTIPNGDNWQGIDNVRLDVVPEPATLILLGIGSLVSLRRRK